MTGKPPRRAPGDAIRRAQLSNAAAGFTTMFCCYCLKADGELAVVSRFYGNSGPGYTAYAHRACAQERGAMLIDEDAQRCRDAARVSNNTRSTVHTTTVGLDPTSSPLAFFGAELRRMRTSLGMSQTTLSKRLHVVSSLISKIETADRVPSEDLADQLDTIFETDGHFGRLWPLAIRHAFPAWFRPYADLEAQAADLRTYECHVVPGLLQTRDYARAVLSTGRWPHIEELLEAHLSRQRILARDEPARLWAILDERVLHRTYGDEGTMRGQLTHILKAAQSPHIVIQVLGYDAAPHPATGPFTTLSFGDGTPDVLHEDGFARGHLTADPTTVRDAHRIYDLLRAAALPPGPSIDLIAATLNDLS